MVLYMKALVASGPGEANKQRVAVGVRARDLLRPDIAAGAADVFDDDRLSPFAPELLGQNARQKIGAAAGRVGDDHLHCARGKRRLRAALPGCPRDR